jgi:hypothetical protein
MGTTHNFANAFLTLVGAVWAGMVWAQNVPALCDTYADAAVRQQRENLESACGFSGAQWNAGRAYHRDWCVQGNNWNSATQWNQWRESQIARCRASAQARPIAPKATMRPAKPVAPRVPSTAIQQLPIAAQQVARQCDGYARTAVEQNQRNGQLGCGLRGPQWSSDHRYHYDWCVSGRNSENAGRGIQGREEQLSHCSTRTSRTPGAQPRLHPATPPAHRATIDLAHRALPRLNESMVRLSQATEQSRRRYYGEPPKDLQHFETRPASVAPRIDTAQLDRMVLDMKSRSPSKPDDGSRLYAPPQIASVTYLPLKKALQPDMYVVVQGSGFGAEHGRAYLEYSSGTGELMEGRTRHHAELQPPHGSWAGAWSGTLVVMQVPHVLPGFQLAGTREAVLLLVRANGATAKADVLLQGGSFPVVTSVKSSRGTIGCCCPVDTESWSRMPNSHDYVYAPSGQRLDQPCGVEKRPWLVPGGTVVIDGERFGSAGTLRVDFGNMAKSGLPQVRFEDVDWTDTRIRATVVVEPAITGYFALRPAFIDVRTPLGAADYVPVAFGPEMGAKWVSGLRWLNRKARAEAQATPNGQLLLVTHVPKCTLADAMKAEKNEKGKDYFFAEPDFTPPDERLPTDVRLTWFHFVQIDPGDPTDPWSVFGPQIWDLAGVILDPASLPLYAVKTLVRGLLLMNEGGYHAYPFAPPGYEGLGSWEKDRFIGIGWETSCAIAEGKPIAYATSFLIQGPPEALAKY